MAAIDFILLIPYYNNFEGLVSSLKSVQYASNKFEVLIVDDGSKEVLETSVLQSLFPEIKLTIIRLPQNAGVAKALNAGLTSILPRTDFNYIARLDCGDICDKERFTQQVTFLNNHSNIVLLGTWCTFTEKVSGRSYLYKTQTEHSGIVKQMHFKCSFIHPTVMFRKEVIATIGLYPEDYPHAEDYAYFWKVLHKFKGAILPENLLKIEVKSSNISSVNYDKQLLSRMKVVNTFGTNEILKLLGDMLILIRKIMPSSLIRQAKFSSSE